MAFSAAKNLKIYLSLSFIFASTLAEAQSKASRAKAGDPDTLTISIGAVKTEGGATRIGDGLEFKLKVKIGDFLATTGICKGKPGKTLECTAEGVTLDRSTLEYQARKEWAAQIARLKKEKEKLEADRSKKLDRFKRRHDLSKNHPGDHAEWESLNRTTWEPIKEIEAQITELERKDPLEAVAVSVQLIEVDSLLALPFEIIGATAGGAHGANIGDDPRRPDMFSVKGLLDGFKGDVWIKSIHQSDYSDVRLHFDNLIEKPKPTTLPEGSSGESKSKVH